MSKAYVKEGKPDRGYLTREMAKVVMAKRNMARRISMERKVMAENRGKSSKWVSEWMCEAIQREERRW